MTQTRARSAYETTMQVCTGLCIGFMLNLTLLPALGVPVDAGQATWIAGLYAAVGWVRSYAVRRWFSRERARPGSSSHR